jgi:hypothetical protein
VLQGEPPVGGVSDPPFNLEDVPEGSAAKMVEHNILVHPSQLS